MSDERLFILKMLDEGKIDAAEAEKLLRALNDKRADTRDAEGDSERETSLFPYLDMSGVVKDAARGFGQAVGSLSKFITEMAVAAGSAWPDDDEKHVVEDREEWESAVGDAVRLSIKNQNGNVELVPGNGDYLRITAEKTVRALEEEAAREVLESIQVRVERENGELVICPHYTKPTPDIQVRVNLHIQCPPNLEIATAALNGAIRVKGMVSNVEANTNNGDIRLEDCKGKMRIHTKNGLVRCDVEDLTEESRFLSANGGLKLTIHACRAPFEAKSLNGSVKVALPGDFSGKLEALSRNGRVHSDFPIQGQGDTRRGRLSGDIGKGGPAVVFLKTMNGQIDLKSLRND